MGGMSDESTHQPHVHHVSIDESEGFDIGPVDWILGFLTMPLLFWALMYAVTGGEGMFATRAARMRLYVVLLVLEALIVVGIWLWLAR